VAGAVIGVALHHLIGPHHPLATLGVIVLALTFGAYFITTAYPLFVTGLVIALVQLYGLTEGGRALDVLLVHRLTENVLGGVIMVLVTLVVWPISTRHVIRAGLRTSLHTLDAFVANLASYLTDPAAPARLRSDVRALDHALFQTRQAAAHLMPVPDWLSNTATPAAAHGPGPVPAWLSYHQRLDRIIDGVSAAGLEAHYIARHAPQHRPRDPAITATIRQIADTFTRSISVLSDHLDSHQSHQWHSCDPLLRQLSEQLRDTEIDLIPTLNALHELDAHMTTLATELGMEVTTAAQAHTLEVIGISARLR
jgi:uncharacterized membrane protein YccC